MGRRTVDRFGERLDDDDEYGTKYCTGCGSILIRPESIRVGKCGECRLDEPLKPFDRPLARKRRL
jgi:hypothetical protein